MVIPLGNTDPEAGPAVRVPVNPIPSQLSLKVGMAYVTTALHNPGSVPVVIGDGQLATAGASVSLTVTVNVQVAVPLPAMSV